MNRYIQRLFQMRRERGTFGLTRRFFPTWTDCVVAIAIVHITCGLTHCLRLHRLWTSRNGGPPRSPTKPVGVHRADTAACVRDGEVLHAPAAGRPLRCRQTHVGDDL